MNICQVCNKELEAKRVDAKFCSPVCRKTANRDKKPVTDKLSVTSGKSKSFTEGLNEQESIIKLYDTFTASELAKAGIRPPKWKKNFKTHSEALNACRNVLKRFGTKEIINYAKWK